MSVLKDFVTAGTETVGRLLLNFGLQVAMLGGLVQGTKKAKDCRCCAKGAEPEPEYPLQPVGAQEAFSRPPDEAQLSWQSSLASGRST